MDPAAIFLIVFAITTLILTKTSYEHSKPVDTNIVFILTVSTIIAFSIAIIWFCIFF